MQVVEVLNPLAREFKSIETLRKELDELQEELAKAHNQVCYWKKSRNHIYGNIQYHQLELIFYMSDAGSFIRSESIICARQVSTYGDPGK